MNKLTKAIETAKEFNKELLNHPLVIEYKKYSNIINSNPKYKELDLKLRSMQKEIINNQLQESSILDITSRTDEYEIYLQEIIQYLKNYYIAMIFWKLP